MRPAEWRRHQIHLLLKKYPSGLTFDQVFARIAQQMGEIKTDKGRRRAVRRDLQQLERDSLLLVVFGLEILFKSAFPQSARSRAT